MSPCPSEEQLLAYAAGDIDSDASEEIGVHVQRCAACQAWLRGEMQAREWFQGVRDVANTDELRSLRDDPLAGPPGGQESTIKEEQPGTVAFPAIPGCEITRSVSSGGQGVVFEARQLSTKRTVAVKLLLPGMHWSAATSKRFAREAELIAQLDHPNIISIYDSGWLDNGAQYYVMEYVDGRQLHQFVRDRLLSLEETLELFAVVCDAVHHAHRNGIIHRDLKPANILIDPDGRPRVLDFGLAKPLSSDDSTLVTVSQNVMGTLAYMSPEQAQAAPVDVRSDVYALGVILYQLLTGSYPYSVEGSITEVLQTIAETPPSPPSLAWKANIGVVRRADRRINAVKSPIDSDIQTLLLKALAKESERRYQTASELARDIRHYLANEPIEARGDSTWYVLRKWLRRYRMAAMFVCVLLAVVIFALVTVTSLRRRAEFQAALAEAGELATKVSYSLTPPNEATLADHLANLKKLDVFLREHDTEAQRSVIAEHVELEERELIDDVETALAANSLAPLAELFVRDEEAPTLHHILKRLDMRGDGTSLLGRLQQRLERWIRIPPPIGRGQEMRDCLTVLLSLDPDNRRGKQLAHALKLALHDLPVVYEDDFSVYETGDVVNDWEQDTGVERCEVLQPEYGMLIASTSTTSSAARLFLNDEAVPSLGDVTVLSWTFRVRAGNPAQISSGGANVRLEGPTGLICRGGVSEGYFEFQKRAETGRWIVTRREPIHADTNYRAELRYFHSRGTYDFIVNGDYVVEEAPCLKEGPVTSICAGTSNGVKIEIRKIELRSGNALLKANLGIHLPVNGIRTIPLDVVRQINLPCLSPIVHDFDDDGKPELVAGDAVEHGKLRIMHLSGPYFDYQVLAEPEIQAAHVEPCDMIDGLLAVAGVGLVASNDHQTSKGFSLLNVGSDFSVTEVFTRLYTQPGRVWVTSFSFPDDASGFAVGLHEPAQFIELYKPTAPGSPRKYSRVCRFTPHKPGDLRSNNVHSIVPFDCDSDGINELAIGWGQWCGCCTTVVDLTIVLAPEETTSSPNGREERNWITSAPLTGRVGLTHLAISDLGTGQLHLIAASERTRLEHDDKAEPRFTTGHGVHVWRVTPDLERGLTEPAFFESSNAIAVAAGRICGQELFIVVSLVECQITGDYDMVLRAYGMRKNRIQAVWDTRFYCVPWRSADLHIADANGDGTSELLLGLGRFGLMVFSGPIIGGDPETLATEHRRL